MLARLIATVAALLLACASPQASAYVRAERVSVSLADLAAIERSDATAPPTKIASTPKTAPPARARPAELASGKNAALSHCRVGENWSPLQNCASMPGVYQWDGTRLAGRTNATGSTLGDYQHAYGWAISSREGASRSTLHTDVHGTPQLITDGTAAIAGWTRTDVWGVEKASTGQQSRLGHTGYLKDPLLGDELYAQARQYRAGVGRFTSRDEWAGDNERPLSLNKYLYGYGNPGSFRDPDGRQAANFAEEQYAIEHLNPTPGQRAKFHNDLARGQVGAVKGAAGFAKDSALALGLMAAEGLALTIEDKTVGLVNFGAHERAAAMREEIAEFVTDDPMGQTAQYLEKRTTHIARLSSSGDMEGAAEASTRLGLDVGSTATGIYGLGRTAAAGFARLYAKMAKPGAVLAESPNGGLRFDPDAEAGSSFQQHEVSRQFPQGSVQHPPIAGHGAIVYPNTLERNMLTLRDGQYVLMAKPHHLLKEFSGQALERGGIEGLEGFVKSDPVFKRDLDAMRLYGPGEKVFNTTIYPVDMPGAPIVRPLPGSITVERPTPLSDLIGETPGCYIVAACTKWID